MRGKSRGQVSQAGEASEAWGALQFSFRHHHLQRGRGGLRGGRGLKLISIVAAFLNPLFDSGHFDYKKAR